MGDGVNSSRSIQPTPVAAIRLVKGIETRERDGEVSITHHGERQSRREGGES